MTTYATLAQEARAHWAALHERPWIRVGTAICGKAAGAQEVLHALRRAVERRGIPATVTPVGCIGLCFAEPLVDIQKPGRPRIFYQKVTPHLAATLVEDYLLQDNPRPDLALGTLGGRVEGIAPLEEHPAWKPQVRIATRNCGTVEPANLAHYIANGGYQGLAKALTEMKPAQVIEEVTKSGLRGRGGAAFSTGAKWNFLARAPGPVKYILVNCEEGDPGAFNDKGILESDPFTLIEGCTIAGYATGATKGYVFIRHGHEGPITFTRKAIQEAYKAGLLGKNILGSAFSFDMEVALTGESYVSGEETALMEAIEGKRAMPRSRPPFPAQVGLWGKPSNINNVKTLSYVPEVVARGGAWFASIGTEKSKGTAIVCLSGQVARPGWYEVPFGLTLRRVVEDIGGGTGTGRPVKLLQTGGPLGGVLGAERLDIALDFDGMAQAGAIFGSGGIIVADTATCAVDLVRNLVAFCQFESCGKCFPCRLGFTHMLEVLDRIAAGQGRPSDLEAMRTIGQAMSLGSLCGHGQLGFNPVHSALRFCAEDFRIHLEERRCPTGACEPRLSLPKRTRPEPVGGWYARHSYAHH
ncbi:MAG: SLBB domain-containing protein [Dehalococcoidia bacterium]|nr:SLBB domain-containing protein [Dehalococcoidia bacterium]MDW8119953.1 NADH-ubiquinone oxidoreductase-F iron-sulfur binding region domain-containing protein [Chloroflexota bacterium]